MKIEPEEVARIRLDLVHRVAENNGSRSFFTVFTGDRLLALDPNLQVIAEWPAGPVADGSGWHATSPEQGLALISDDDEVRMVDVRGRVIWRHEHDRWRLRSGCAWFDRSGEPYALTPEQGSEGCRIVRLDPQTGETRSCMPVDTVPDMVKPVHRRDGWVGLPTEERHEGGRTWWVRSRPGPAAEFDVIDPGWEDCYFTDVDASGTRILTTSASLDDGIIQVRSFPGLDIVRTIKPQDATHPWGHMACFADDLIIVTVIDFNTGDQTRGAVDPAGTFHPMPGDCEREWIDPATDGTWLIGTGTTLRRYRATRR